MAGTWCVTKMLCSYKNVHHLRLGAAAATATNWLFGFVCTQFTPIGIKNITYKFYISKSIQGCFKGYADEILVFASFNLAFIPIVYFLYPEVSELCHTLQLYL